MGEAKVHWWWRIIGPVVVEILEVLVFLDIMFYPDACNRYARLAQHGIVLEEEEDD